MSLRQFACFVAVVDEGSFTRGARLLGITQPSLSHHVRALEEDIGGPLLERLPRGVALTPAGRTLLPEARAAMDREWSVEQMFAFMERDMHNKTRLTTHAPGEMPVEVQAALTRRPVRREPKAADEEQEHGGVRRKRKRLRREEEPPRVARFRPFPPHRQSGADPSHARADIYSAPGAVRTRA